ncbi:kinase-like domain-containing protein [Cladochytrium replicatum]|nr:kinase-like domain-containing protein [Cladochytrium replicatum]
MSDSPVETPLTRSTERIASTTPTKRSTERLGSTTPTSRSTEGLASTTPTSASSPKARGRHRLQILTLPHLNVATKHHSQHIQSPVTAKTDNETPPASAVLNDLLSQWSVTTPISSAWKAKRKVGPMIVSGTPVKIQPYSMPEPNLEADTQAAKNGDPLEEYNVGKTIGEGSFGKVKLATHIATGEQVAIKCLSKAQISTQPGQAERLLREILVLATLTHPNICRLYQVIDSAPSQTIYLVLEHASGGELFDFVVKARGGVGDHRARTWMRQMIAAVGYCHERDVVHRDLKPENVLMDTNGNIKIIDFGFSNVMKEGNLLETFCGSAAYAAPEMIAGKQYAGREVDVWSLGVILYVLVCGQLPWDDRNMSRMFVEIMSCKVKIPDEISAECRDLIRKILQKNPQDRPTLQSLASHPYLTENGRLQPVSFQGFDDHETPTTSPHHHEAMTRMEMLNFDRPEVETALESGDPGPLHATYWLVRSVIERERKRSQFEELADAIEQESTAEATDSRQISATNVSQSVEKNGEPLVKPVVQLSSPDDDIDEVEETIRPATRPAVVEEEDDSHAPERFPAVVHASAAGRRAARREKLSKWRNREPRSRAETASEGLEITTNMTQAPNPSNEKVATDSACVPRSATSVTFPLQVNTIVGNRRNGHATGSPSSEYSFASPTATASPGIPMSASSSVSSASRTSLLQRIKSVQQAVHDPSPRRASDGHSFVIFRNAAATREALHVRLEELGVEQKSLFDEEPWKCLWDRTMRVAPPEEGVLGAASPEQAMDWILASEETKAERQLQSLRKIDVAHSVVNFNINIVEEGADRTTVKITEIRWDGAEGTSGWLSSIFQGIL